MTIFTARVAAVNTLPLGSVLIEDAPIGATELTVEDGADFNASGGYAILGGTEVVEFSSADDEARTLTLVAPLEAAWPADTRVELWDETANTLVVETIAQILSEGGDAGAGDSLEAIVDHSLIPFLPEGIRGGTEDEPARGPVGEAVEVERRGDELVVVNILGQAPVLNGAMIDPDTLPAGGGPEPEVPIAPQAPTVTGGIGSLLIRWEPILHPNPVSYEVHVSDTTPVVPSEDTFVGEVNGSQITVRRLPVPNVDLGSPDSPLEYDVPYYAVVIAKDSVDTSFASEPSAEGVGQPVQATSGDLAVDSVTASNIAAGAITGESFAGELLLGSRITTAEAGQRVEMDTNGLRLYNSADDLRVDLPTDPTRDPSFRGRVEADGLTVREGAQFFSTLNEFAKDSRISLAEQVAAPVAAPSVAMTWGSVQLEQRVITGSAGTFALDPSQIACAAWHPTLNVFTVQQNRPGAGSRRWYYNLDGTLAALSPQPISDYAGSDGEYRVVGLGYTTDGVTITLLQFNGGDYWIQDPRRAKLFKRYTRQNPNRVPTLTVDSGNNIWVAEQSTGGPMIFRRVDTSGSGDDAEVVGLSTSSGVADAQWAPRMLYKGSADFGGDRFVVAGRNVEPYRVLAFNGGTSTYQPNEVFPPPVTRAGGFWVPAPVARFFTVGTDGRLYMHSDIRWTDPAQDTWHLAQSFYDSNPTGGTHETLVGAVRSFTMTKRAHVRVTLQQVPYAGGTDDPDRWRLYGKRGSAPGVNGAGMTLQAEGPYTSTQHTQGVMLTTSGAAPPTVSNFPGATPARLVSARAMPGNAAQPILDLRGDGSGQWGPIQIGGDGKYAPSYDTGWVDIPGASGTTSTLQGRRVGNVVYLRGTVAPAGEWVDGTTATLVSSMPAQFRPSQAFRFTAAPSAVSGNLYFNVAVGNSITARSSRAAGPTAVFFPLTYLAD